MTPNRLASEKSPYLRQHAQNPVEWYPWGEEAFARARTEQKPIFLSVGYSTCHWCHVMEHESFESAAIAAFLNAHFVSIKVDREERPDVDAVYMAFIQATVGQGGWPMSVWLTPERRPFYGGTYFPPTDHPGQPGFITILRQIARLWTEDRTQVTARADSLLAALREAQAEVTSSTDPAREVALDVPKTLAQALSFYARMFDPGAGGFGRAPKFPRPVNLELLLQLASAKSSALGDADLARGMAATTLREMARGGIYDHLGGGFHRYSVDAAWHVPHFEKMLYDQAQLASVYLTASQVCGDASFAETARRTLGYVQNEMTHPEGGFYSAEDADSLPTTTSQRKIEGAFYVWRAEEIAAELGPERAREFAAGFGVEAAGNVPPELDPHGDLTGLNVLTQRLGSESATAATRPALAQLFARRAQRPRPHLDDKILTAWNGLMIGAFARGFCVLGERGFLQSAQKSADFIRNHLYDEATGQLLRSYREGPATIAGFAADYASLIHGLLELYQADFDVRWLTWALRLQARLDADFFDESGGGYFSSGAGDPTILLRLKDDYDGAEPTPSSLAARNLARLSQLGWGEVYRTRAQGTVRAFAGRLEEQPFALPLLLQAAAQLEAPPAQLILHAPTASDPAFAALLETARRAPGLQIVRIASASERDFFAAVHPAVAALPADSKNVSAYLCENFTCRLPLATPEELAQALGFHDSAR